MERERDEMKKENGLRGTALETNCYRKKGNKNKPEKDLTKTVNSRQTFPNQSLSRHKNASINKPCQPKEAEKSFDQRR